MLSADQGITYGFRQEAWRQSLRLFLTSKKQINDDDYWITELSESVEFSLYSSSTDTFLDPKGSPLPRSAVHRVHIRPRWFFLAA